MGFKQVLDNLAVKHINALRKQIQSLADYVLNHCCLFSIFCFQFVLSGLVRISSY